MIKTRILLAVGDGGELPTEFRLFTKGWNDTENGRFLFDDRAAQAVMSAYREWGVDLMIDLEHQSLDVTPGAADPTARDARGWSKLELRNGELWSVSVTWTPDGADRLKQKRQRYVSPAFEADPKTKRVLKMINVAITSIPATHDTPALVAASRRNKIMVNQLQYAKNMVKLAADAGLDPALVQKALDAVEKGDAKAALDILKSLIASAAGAEPPAEGDDDGSEGDGAEGVAPPATDDDTETEAVEDPKVVDNAADPTPADDDEEEDPKKPAPAKNAANRALHGMLYRLTGKKTLAEAVAEVENFRASHLTLETERKKLSTERATMESAERRKLVADLVKLGAEFPATVWADDKATVIKPRWAKMPIAELRSHVAEQRAARGAKTPKDGIKPGLDSTSPEVAKLSASELAICSQMKCDPKDFASLKSFRDSGKKGN